MTLLKLLVLALTVVSAGLATPTPPEQTSRPEFFMFRGNAPQKPWNDRAIVALPTTQQLGFENHTVHPATLPIAFRPVQLPNGNFALRGEGVGDDLSKTPWLAALASKAEAKTVSMKVVYLPSPTSQSLSLNPEACPREYECKVDQWTIGGPAPGSEFKSLSYAEFSGVWSAVKDAGKEGWHVYWKENADEGHDIKLDLVPVNHNDFD